MLKTIKQRVFRLAEASGFSERLGRSSWRRRRLLILCYHGVAMHDEHLWNPSLFLEAGVFRRRLELLRENGCSVLPLPEALARLSAGTLPPRSVAITVDDGLYDFYRMMLPALREFGYPATLYLTTYYSDFNRPVFDPACAYLLWKATGTVLEWPRVFPRPLRLDAAGRARAFTRLTEYWREQKMSGLEKDVLLAELAGRTGVDYEGFCAARQFTILRPGEVREIAAAGVDVQLHTHRHRVYRDKQLFLRELDDNRCRIETLTGLPARHFCYPSGTYLPEFIPWLREWGVESAATCEAGLAGRHSDRMLLPRLVDVSGLSEVEFRAWLSGTAAFLPSRRTSRSYWSLWSAGPQGAPAAVSGLES